MKRSLVAAIVFFAFLLPASLRAGSDDPAAIIRASVDAALVVLRDPTLKKPEKRAERLEKLRVIADRVFNWQELAQSSLGATYRTITEAQRVEFVALFKDMIAQDYRDDLDRFMGDENVLMKGTEDRGELRVVKTILVTHSRDQVPLDYFMHREGDSWRAVDFSVEGVSLVNHYRKSFARFLVNHSFEELLAKLRPRATRK